ncbi:MAG TPA: CAAX prenyl protease-related protein [Tepidisphaeraceae bacterium]|nr:CAAX prenyl protease-related protein [Tepidisphaeraceae bacterium]
MPVADDIAYVAPMACFLLFTWVGGTWPSLFAASYLVKTILTAILLWLLWPAYTRISWRFIALGVLAGVLGVIQWVGMEQLLLSHWPNYPRMHHDVFNPFQHFATPAEAWSFIAIRWAGATLLVPVMEELFWRDFLWRMVLAPNDFKLAAVGEWDLSAFLIVAVAFGAGVHIEWMTAIVWGLMIGLLLIWTKSLGACIVMHGVTNFLLGAYVLHTGQWLFW